MTSTKRVARLLLQDVGEIDTAQIFAVLNNTRYRCFNEWQVIFDGPADIVIFGGDEPITIRGLLEPPMQTLQLVPAAAQVDTFHGTLTTPIRYAAFATLLAELDRTLALHRSTGDRRSGSMSPKRAAVPPLRRASDAPFRALLRGEAVARLRNVSEDEVDWEREGSARLLGSMLNRFISFSDMVEASGVTRSECEAFLYAVILRGQLEIRITAPSMAVLSAKPAGGGRDTNAASSRADTEALMRLVTG